MITIRRGASQDVTACLEVLSQLPDYFTPDTFADIEPGFIDHSAWVATDHGAIIGFLIAERRYAKAAEITFAAVRPERHGQGVGTELLDVVLTQLADEGVVFVEVKTLDASSDYEPYIATRAFWERRGFVQVDCIDPLPGWQPGNPSAIYVAALVPTHIGPLLGG